MESQKGEKYDMRVVKNQKELQKILPFSKPRLDILIPMEAIKVRGYKQIYCPNCGHIVNGFRQDKKGEARCQVCHRNFFL